MLKILTLLLAVSAAASPQPPQDKTDPASRWAVQSANGPVGRAGVVCHALGYFSDAGHLGALNYSGQLIGEAAPGLTYTSDFRSHRVGEIEGFDIEEVRYRNVEEYNAEIQPYSVMKMILVQRKPGEFCELFNQQGLRGSVDLDDAVAIVDTGSGLVLAAGNKLRQYWTFDAGGPVPLDLRVIDDALRKLLPADAAIPGREGFDIKTLTYSARRAMPGDAPCCPAGETIHIQFVLKNHQLAIVGKSFDSAPPHP